MQAEKNMEQRKYYKNNDRSGQGRRPARERAEADTAENLLEGRNAVQEALAAGRTIDKLYIADGDTDRGPARLLCRRIGASSISSRQRGRIRVSLRSWRRMPMRRWRIFWKTHG